MTKEMPDSNVWKIAPGNRASNWDLFRKSKCIGIGWLRDYDYNDFASVNHVTETLVEIHGERAPGNSTGSARMIWAFTNQVRNGHVVVANDGYNSVVGVGIIDSDYISPHEESNPLFNDESTHRHHVRRVKWLITKPITIRGSRFFIQGTIGPLIYDQMANIRDIYLKEYPDDANIRKQFKRIFEKLTAKRTP